MKIFKFIYITIVLLVFNKVSHCQKTNQLPDYLNNIKPSLIWEFKGIGNGYSSPTIVNDKIFITGEIDSIGYLFALNLKGKLLWKKPYGKEWMKNYIGSRAAPVYSDNLVYVSSGLGKIICFASETGKYLWSIDMIKDLGGKNIVFGYSMSVAINDNLLFCFPGGNINNVVALNKLSGEIEWTSKGDGEIAGYASPIIINLPKIDILVTFSEFSLLGFNSINGKLLWTHILDDFGSIPCNSPIYEKGNLYYVAGTRNGAVKLILSENGDSITEVWRNLKFDTYYSGIKKVGNNLFGYTESNHSLSSINIISGQINSELKLARGSITSANDKIYYYTEKGQVSVIETNNGKPKLTYTFKINKGTKEYFSHPAIYNKILLIRHGNVLLAYNLQSEL